jgi:hypothetical protein
VHQAIVRQPHLKLSTVPSDPLVIETNEIKIDRNGSVDRKKRDFVIEAQFLHVIFVLRSQILVDIGLRESSRNEVPSTPIL